MANQNTENKQNLTDNICNELLQKGIKPTVTLVLAKIPNINSRSTVHKYFKKWADEQNRKKEDIFKKLGFSSEFTSSVLNEVSRFNCETEQRYIEQAQYANDQRNHAISDLQNSENKVNEQASLISQFEEMINNLQTELATEQKSNESTVAEIRKQLTTSLSENKKLTTQNESLRTAIAKSELRRESNQELVDEIKSQNAQLTIDNNHSLIDLNNNIDTPEYYCHYYIIKKLVHICKTYNSYTCFIRSKPKPDADADADFIPVSFSKIDEFIDTLRKDHSHTTYKLRQAINFLKHDIYPENTWDNINIESTSLLIHDIVSQSHNEKVEYFLPPSFLSVDIHSEKIYSEDRIEFSRLSSGEKQKIYVINSILYHLRNLDSVSESGNDKLNKYNYVNVFLDEIELCFHPELQRMFILELRDTLKKLNLKYIYGLNFCFVTHSPFLLSDIPSTNILLLDNMDKNKKLGVTFPLKYDTNSKKTFAANIHDLLVDGFFMDGSIGAFAESTIKDIVKLHADISNDYELGLNKSKYEQNFHRYEFIHAEIGDGFIKNVIGNHLSEIRKKLKKPRHEKIIDNEIRTLEERIYLLKKEKSHDKN